jgi:hypothetical protein
MRLVPIMAVLYLLAHIDRANIGNAKIEGMDKDLGLTGNQYNIATTLFFIPYIIFGMLYTQPLVQLSTDSRAQKSHQTWYSSASVPASGSPSSSSPGALS